METAFLVQGLLAAHQYFAQGNEREPGARTAYRYVVARRRVVVVSQRAERPLLALESRIRVGDEFRRTRVQRVSGDVYSGGRFADLSDRPRGLYRGVGRERGDRRRARGRGLPPPPAVSGRRGRSALLGALLLPRAGSARAERRLLRGLFRRDARLFAHQPCLLHPQSPALQGLRQGLLGADGQLFDGGVCGASLRRARGSRRDRPHGGAFVDRHIRPRSRWM